MGLKKYYYNGKLHREQGAAIEKKNGFLSRYYINGIETKQELLHEMISKHKITQF